MFQIRVLSLIVLLLVIPWGISALHAGEIAYDSGGRRNPFVPLVGKDGMVQVKAHGDSLTVDGIVYDPAGDSIVLIKGESYREGDSFANMTITSIFRDRIVLHQSDQEKVLWIREEVVDNKGVGKAKA
ncbi:MAG: hypothetical protein WC352_04390 [Candidatus Omnitrophota bacterium]